MPPRKTVPQSYAARLDAGRVMVSTWVAADVRDSIDTLSTAWGATIRGVVERAIREAIERENRRQKKDRKEA